MTEISNDESFEDFVHAACNTLLRYGHALTGSIDDAWDLTQESLARMGERWATQPIQNPEAYARAVMIRLNVDRHRRTRRDREKAMRADVARDPSDQPDADSWLPNALRQLTPRQRTALALRYVNDLDTETIAAAMRCSPGTARSHLSQAMSRLRELAPAPRSAATYKEDPV